MPTDLTYILMTLVIMVNLDRNNENLSFNVFLQFPIQKKIRGEIDCIPDPAPLQHPFTLSET
jgi:hypothetical protein